MAYALRLNKSVKHGLRRIAAELIDDSIALVEREDADRDEVVHEVRKNCKKLRGLLRLVRPCAPDLYALENAFFRDAAQSLSTLRDAEASIEAYDALMEHFADQVDRPAMGPIRRALTLHKQGLAKDGDDDLDQSLATFRVRMLEARERVKDWPLAKDSGSQAGFELLGPGLEKTYGRGRDTMRAAFDAPSVTAFHDWRKRVKDLRYHLRLLHLVWPGLLQPTRDEVKRLSDLLGDDHDIAVLHDTLPEALKGDADPARSETFIALMQTRSQELRAQAQWLGLRIYAERPKALRKRMHRYWRAAKQEDQAARAP